MRKVVVCFSILLFILTASFLAMQKQSEASSSVIQRELSQDELTRLEAGEVILESQKYENEAGEIRGRGLAIAYVKANKKAVMDTLLDYPSYPQFMPRVKNTEVYLNTPTQINVKFTLKVVITIVYYIKHYVDRDAGTIAWELDNTQENDIKDTTGSWLVKPHKQGCLLFYSVALDTGRSVPGWLEDYLTKKDLPNVVRAVKEKVGG